MKRGIAAVVVFALVGCSSTGSKNDDPNNTNANNWINNESNNASTNSSTNSSTNNGATNSSTNNGATNNASGPCPATQPSDSDACSEDGLTCEWGDDPREECRTRGTCTGGAWALTAAATCDPLPDVACPPTRDDASGEACEAMNAICEYPDGLTCLCTNCTVGGPVEMCGGDPDWKCQAPNSDPECPVAKPRLGEVCEQDRKECTYSCGPGGARTCTGGVWTEADGGPCPISTAKVKQGIRYLSKAELAQVSRELQSMRLARWQYTDPALGKGDKLGFIIEDLPKDTPAVDRDRMMVDLYGYTSMLVADAQAREAKMDELEARMKALEAKLDACEPE